MKNHGLRIYPELGNTIDYKIMDESFNIIILHTQTLAEAVCVFSCLQLQVGYCNA
jgi:hypothetical protein